MKMGSNARTREIPELFTAVSSECSPRFPKVIMELRSTANGKASGELEMEK